LKEVEAGVNHGRGTGIIGGMAKTPEFNETTSWAMFQHQFKIVEEHNC
jgi:hypothetical protein